MHCGHAVLGSGVGVGAGVGVHCGQGFFGSAPRLGAAAITRPNATAQLENAHLAVTLLVVMAAYFLAGAMAPRSSLAAKSGNSALKRSEYFEKASRSPS